MYRPTYVEINLDNIAANFRWLQQHQLPFICPMVKANAYGHGDIEVASKLHSLGCDHLGVGLVEEGIRLKAKGLKSDIMVYGFYGEDSSREILDHGLTPVISDWQQLENIASQVTREHKIHLKFDTGMHRLGFSPNEAEKVRDRLKQTSLLKLEGVCTHFLNGEDLCNDSGGFSQGQETEFKKIASWFKDSQVFLHIYNSAALASVYLAKRNIDFGARPGLLVYGVDPMKGESLKPLISPVMQFKSNIVATQRVKSGEVVSYGGIWRAKCDSTIGIIPAGYADGIARSLSNCGEVLMNGVRVPMVGHVCMDYVMVDLTELVGSPDQHLGREVVFFGQQGDASLSVEEVASMAQRTAYEILTGISERVPRIYKENL